MLERSWLLHACLLLCSLALVGLLASPVGLFASLFLFDAPGSFNPIVLALALALWSFPLTWRSGYWDIGRS